MKQIIYLLFGLLLFLSCNDLAKNPPQFVELGNAKRAYQVFNEDGTPKMVADSIYNKAGVKIALAGTTRHVMLIKADSAAFVQPSAAFVRETKGMDQYANFMTIAGIILLLGIIPVWLFAKKGQAKFFILPQTALSFVLFFFGMNGVQKKFFDISVSNKKTISMDAYRHYFNTDTTGYYFWDSIRKKGGIVDFVPKK